MQDWLFIISLLSCLFQRLESFDQAKMMLQRSSVASPRSCPMVVEQGAGEITLEQLVESLLEVPYFKSDIVTAVNENEVRKDRSLFYFLAAEENKNDFSDVNKILTKTK